MDTSKLTFEDFNLLLLNTPNSEKKEEAERRYQEDKEEEKRLLSRIKECVKKGNKDEVINIFSQRLLREILWIQPNSQMIQFIQKFVTENGLHGICSVGCGSGILEWLIRKEGVDVYGIECHPFLGQELVATDLEIEYVEESTDVGRIKENFALMQCYGHKAEVFYAYFNSYQKLPGKKAVIIIGTKGLSFPEPKAALTNFKDWHCVASMTTVHAVDICIYTPKE